MPPSKRYTCEVVPPFAVHGRASVRAKIHAAPISAGAADVSVNVHPPRIHNTPAAAGTLRVSRYVRTAAPQMVATPIAGPISRTTWRGLREVASDNAAASEAVTGVSSCGGWLCNA